MRTVHPLLLVTGSLLLARAQLRLGRSSSVIQGLDASLDRRNTFVVNADDAASFAVFVLARNASSLELYCTQYDTASGAELTPSSRLLQETFARNRFDSIFSPALARFNRVMLPPPYGDSYFLSEQLAVNCSHTTAITLPFRPRLPLTMPRLLPTAADELMLVTDTDSRPYDSTEGGESFSIDLRTGNMTATTRRTRLAGIQEATVAGDMQVQFLERSAWRGYDSLLQFVPPVAPVITYNFTAGTQCRLTASNTLGTFALCHSPNEALQVHRFDVDGQQLASLQLLSANDSLDVIPAAISLSESNEAFYAAWQKQESNPGLSRTLFQAYNFVGAAFLQPPYFSLSPVHESLDALPNTDIHAILPNRMLATGKSGLYSMSAEYQLVANPEVSTLAPTPPPTPMSTVSRPIQAQATTNMMQASPASISSMAATTSPSLNSPEMADIAPERAPFVEAARAVPLVAIMAGVIPVVVLLALACVVMQRRQKPKSAASMQANADAVASIRSVRSSHDARFFAAGGEYGRGAAQQPKHDYEQPGEMLDAPANSGVYEQTGAVLGGDNAYDRPDAMLASDSGYKQPGVALNPKNSSAVYGQPADAFSDGYGTVAKVAQNVYGC